MHLEVHLEVLHDMTTEELLLAFRRFFARRGVPQQIISDNAPQFHQLDGCFSNIWHEFSKAPATSVYFAEKRITWSFIPEMAPWMGGMYERLVKSVKQALERTYGDKVLQERQFEATVLEVESIVNSRPLTYVDGEQESPILTPNDFTMAKFSAVPIEYQRRVESDDALQKLWRSSQAHLDAFWRHWSNHYLILLRERNDHVKNPRYEAKKFPEKGDIVVMIEQGKKRSQWQMAVVERRIHSSDGQIRAAQIRIEGGSRLIRPIAALAPLYLQMDLPNIRDDQLTRRRDAIFLSPPEGAAQQ